MMISRKFLARSDHPIAQGARALYRAVKNITLPAPKPIVVPALTLYTAQRDAYHFLRRVLFAEPLFKAYCRSYGKGVRTDIFVHWIQGKGDLIVGDNVLFDGKSSITFAARYCDNPTLLVGNNTGISDGCTITVGKKITIGNYCRIASDVFISDTNGHASDPVLRMQGAPPTDDEVRPVAIGNNVWIGRRAIIMPGVTIGEGSIVSSGAVVMSDVAPYTIVAGNPARKIGSLQKPAEAEQNSPAAQA